MYKENRRKEFPTEWMNLIRFISIFFIVWSHYENRAFAEVIPSGLNIQRMFFFPPSLTSYIFYGYTGKYAVAMLCVISGFITAWTCSRKKAQSFPRFFAKRYLRLMLPVQGISIIYLVINGLFGSKVYTAGEILKGLFLPGAYTICDYYWCLSAFLLGNCLIYFLDRCDEKTQEWNSYMKLAVLFAFVAGGLLVSYKIYNSQMFWMMVVVSGYFVYELYEKVDWKLPGYMVFFCVILLYWLPRGEESLKLYMRYCAASCLFLYMMLNRQRILEKVSVFCKRKRVAALLEYSFSLFLVHGLTQQIFIDSLISGIQSWTGQWWITYILSFCLKMMIDFFFAMIIHQLFETKIYRVCCRYL